MSKSSASPLYKSLYKSSYNSAYKKPIYKPKRATLYVSIYGHKRRNDG